MPFAAMPSSGGAGYVKAGLRHGEVMLSEPLHEVALRVTEHTVKNYVYAELMRAVYKLLQIIKRPELRINPEII